MPGAAAAGAGLAPAPGRRSAVSATMACSTPGTSRTAFSAAWRSGSSSRALSAGTVMEKITLPLATTISETMPRLTMSPVRSGPLTCRSAARTCSLVTADILLQDSVISLPL